MVTEPSTRTIGFGQQIGRSFNAGLLIQVHDVND
jgi:hypothetical protein